MKKIENSVIEYYLEENGYGIPDLLPNDTFFTQEPSCNVLADHGGFGKMMSMLRARMIEQLFDIGGCLDADIS